MGMVAKTNWVALGMVAGNGLVARNGKVVTICDSSVSFCQTLLRLPINYQPANKLPSTDILWALIFCVDVNPCNSEVKCEQRKQTKNKKGAQDSIF